MTADQAIGLSVSSTSIVTLTYTKALDDDLLCACEDNTQSGKVHEFWGRTPCGHDWRVHLHEVETDSDSDD